MQCAQPSRVSRTRAGPSTPSRSIMLCTAGHVRSRCGSEICQRLSHYADMLLDHAKRHALGRWQLYGRGYQGAVAIRRGDIAAGLRLLRASFEELGETGIVAPRFLRFTAVYMAEALGQAGQTSDGLVVIDEAIARAERTRELWELAELMRIKGELLLLMQNAPRGGDRGRELLSASARSGTPARGFVLGIARRDESRTVAARSRPSPRCKRNTSTGLPPIHRGL